MIAFLLLAALVALVIVGRDTLERRLSSAVALALLSAWMATPARAQEPSPPPTAAPSPKPSPTLNPNAAPLEISAQLGGVVTMSGDTSAAATPTAWVDVDGPLVLGPWIPGRVYARLGITSLPGETLDPADVRTFKGAEVGIGARRIVGSLHAGEQLVETSIVGEWSFATPLNATPAAALRLVRAYGGGLRFDERRSGASLTILYGRDEAAGDRGWGNWMLYGSVPIAGTKGSIVIVGDATLAVGPQVAWLHQRDILRLGVVLDAGSLVSAIRGK